MTTTTNDDNTVIIETLLNWGRENGIRTHPNVAIQQRIIKNGDEDDEEDERGIFYERLDDERDDVNDVNDATTTTTETLVSIPEKALLCVPRRQTETTTKRLEEEEDDALCKILLRESKNTNSFWSAYLRTLPNEYDLLELWTDEEVETLQVDAAKASARELRGKVSASYDRQCRRRRTRGFFFTRAEWAYAKATVRSRTVSVPWSSAGALAPIGDMFNYAPVGGFLGGDDDGNGNFCNGDEKEDGCVPVGTGAWNANENAFEFRGTLPKKFSPTTRSFELFMNYGAYTNLELLSLYGFHCGENNPNDVIVLDVPLITTQTTEYHAKLIATSGALTFESERDLRLEYARRQTPQRAHAAAQRHSFSAFASRGEKLSNASEHNFCTAIRDAAGRALLSFATTAKQDCESLEHLKNSSANTEKDTNAGATRRRRTKLAVEYRLAVKRALQKTYRILLLDAVVAARGEVWFPKIEDVVFEYLNESTKFVVSATAMVFLMFHPTVETCWCLLGSIVNSVNGKLLKRALNHSRPDGAKKVDPGMPSSHATSLSYLSWYAALAFAFEPNAFGLATTVTRTLAFGLVSLGAFLAYLRVKLGFHTWPQVYVGYGLGSSTALVWILFGKRYLIQHLARHPERLKNLHACLVVAIGLFALSAIKWVKELVKSSSKSKKQNA
ncbi:unnamed protein product [Bathycoccus prasinos]